MQYYLSMITHPYTNRKFIIFFIIILVGIVFIFRLFYLQVLYNKYKFSADNNVIRYITQYPSRGLIYDHNGELLVYNEAAYDLLVVPHQVHDFDTNDLCNLLHISIDEFCNRYVKAKKYSMYKPSVFLEQISREDYAFLGEKLYKFPGFYVQARTLRKYPFPIAAHILGYIGEVTLDEIEHDSYYKSRDYIGKTGIEKFFEKTLRGKKGIKVKVVDVFNREMGNFHDGDYDISAIAGSNITISLDVQLQAYGEQLMKNKKGSIVAIEPASGEILALITSPSYDPNVLVGRIRSHNYNLLLNDSLKPLINRAIMGTYSPGSTFKIVNVLIGLQEKVLSPQTLYSCDGPESRPIKCTHYHVTPLDLKEAIQQSCNAYLWKVFRSIITHPDPNDPVKGYNVWYNHVLNLGFGKKFNTDIPFELNGNIPESRLYDSIYRKNHWTALTIRSLAIGQGEILVTPLQLANFAAIIANRGYYYPPHFLKSTKYKSNTLLYYPGQVTSIEPKHYEFIVDAMLEVVEGEHGTARWYKIDSVHFCGKTGTVENPHGKDHSMFIAFAPKDNPTIALSVIVENAGYGATWAAPIASLLIEKYLKGKVKRHWLENRMLNSDLISSN